MKIGFSLGRCVRDIVNGDVGIDDVAFLITATYIKSPEQLDNVINTYLFEPGYLIGLDGHRCLEVARQLWDSNRIIQPRAQGMHRHAQQKAVSGLTSFQLLPQAMKASRKPGMPTDL